MSDLIRAGEGLGQISQIRRLVLGSDRLHNVVPQRLRDHGVA